MKKNKIAVELHETLHKKKINIDNFFKNPRLKIFPYVEKITGKKISGNVLDIGAGSGYAGIWLAKNRDTQVTLLECTNEATQNTIPYFAKHFDVLNSCQIRNGTFNDLSAFEEKFDYIVCFGVLHHSKNLLKVLDNVIHALKPGGILIANEPFTKNSIDNKIFNDIYNSKENFAGKLIRHGDRDDHFYRECEWLTAVHHSGLSIIKLQDLHRILNKNNLRSILSSFIFYLKRYFNVAWIKQEVSFAEMRSQKLNPRHMLLLCQKPSFNDTPPHRWNRFKR